MMSPVTIHGTTRVHQTANAQAVDGRGGTQEADASLVLRGRHTARTQIVAQSETVTASDASRHARIASALTMLCDPMVMLGLARAALKDAQISQQKQAIDTQSDRAQHSAEDRQVALEKALQSAEEAKGWGVFAQVALRVVAVVVAAVAVVTGAFTGGAGIALAAGLLIVAFGNDLALAMDEAGADKDVTNAIGIGASIVGTCFTFGASLASVGAAGAQAGAMVAQQTAEQAANAAQQATLQATKQAVQQATEQAVQQAVQHTAQEAVKQAVEGGTKQAVEKTLEQVITELLKTVKEVTQSAGQIVGGTGRAVSALYTWDASNHHIDAEVATAEISDATDMIDGYVEDTREFMESYQRVVERLARTVEARDETMRAASQQRA